MAICRNARPAIVGILLFQKVLMLLMYSVWIGRTQFQVLLTVQHD